MLTRRQFIAAGASSLVLGSQFEGIFVSNCCANETPYRRPLSDIPLSEMTDEQLVRFASSGIAGGCLSGIGNLAFEKLMEELNGRPRSLEDILADQTRQLAIIIEQAIEENEIKKLRAMCIAVQRTMTEYKNAPTDPKLENVDTSSQELLALTEAFGRNAYPTFLLASSLRFCVLKSRWDRFKTAGDKKNLKIAIERSIKQNQKMYAEWLTHLTEPIGLVLEVGGRNEWIRRYYVHGENLRDRVLTLEVITEAELYKPFIGFTTTRQFGTVNADGQNFSGMGHIYKPGWKITTQAAGGRAKAQSIDATNNAEATAHREGIIKWVTQIFEDYSAGSEIEKKWKEQLLLI